MDVAPLGLGDQLLRQRTYPLRLGFGSDDPAMLEQLGGQIGQNQPLVRSTAAEACALGGCGHVLSCSRSANYCRGSLGRPPCSAGVQGGRPLALILLSLAEVDLVFVQVVVAADGAQRV